jgi:hypothetical protein
MSLRKLPVKEVVIRLTERGFVETVRWFGLPIRSVYYDTPPQASPELVRVRRWGAS